MPRLLELYTIGLFGTLLMAGCANEQGATGYCLNDRECQTGTCDPATSRCIINTGLGDLSDTGLDRKLDMMIVDMATPDMVIVDMATPDMVIVDVALPDAELGDAVAPDQTLVIVDAALDQQIISDSELMDLATLDSSPPDGATTDTVLVDAETRDADGPDVGNTSPDPASQD